MNKSNKSIFTLTETSSNQYCTIKLSAKDYITEDDQYVNAVVLFHENVIVDIEDLKITRKYSCLNGLAGDFPSRLFVYLKSA
ncbi:MAG: hypothetical protein ACTSP3_11900 [Candidatus Heimdallarchaeaceae archaeon]